MNSESKEQNFIAGGRFKFQLTERQLLCVNECGFYGTPQWQGMCSQCWRFHQIQVKKQEDYNKNRALLQQESAYGRKSSETRFNTIRAILKKSPSVFVSSVHDDSSNSTSNAPLNPPSSPVNSRSLSPDSQQVHQQFGDYLFKHFNQSVAKETEKQCQLFVDKLFRSEQIPLDELSEDVQQFYKKMADKIARQKTLPVEFKLSTFYEELEKYICISAYNALFCSRTDEEASDLALQERIRSLHWVTFGFLDTCLDFSSTQVNELLDEAMNQIVDLNSHRPIGNKLDCLINCSKHIFDALKESRSGAAASADEFLPVLIYIILKANPSLIQSNLKFISRFSLPFRIMRGESGYYFTNLSCAIQFILDMNARSLRMLEDDFEAYTSGKRVAPTRMSNSVIKSIEDSLMKVNELTISQARMEQKIKQLPQKFDRDRENFKADVRSFLNEEPRKEVQLIREQFLQVPPPNSDNNNSGNNSEQWKQHIQPKEQQQQTDDDHQLSLQTIVISNPPSSPSISSFPSINYC